MTLESGVEMADGSVMGPSDDLGLGEAQAAPETQADDQIRGESQTEEPDDIDLSQPMFAYTDPATGEERQLTGEEIVALIEGSSKAQKADSPDQGQQTPEEDASAQPPAMALPDMPEVEPLDYAKVGEVYEIMLGGGDPERGIPGPEAMGDMFSEFVTRHVATNPMMDAIIAAKVGQILQAQEGFKQFTGEFGNPLAEKDAIDSWRKSNPIYGRASDAEAFALMKLQAANKTIAELKSGQTKAVKEAEAQGKKAGEEATVKSIQTKRNVLRPLTGKGTGARGPVATTNQSGKFADIKAKYDLTNPEQRTLAMAEGIARMRGQG